jgi:hypothetical protein
MLLDYARLRGTKRADRDDAAASKKAASRACLEVGITVRTLQLWNIWLLNLTAGIRFSTADLGENVLGL